MTFWLLSCSGQRTISSGKISPNVQKFEILFLLDLLHEDGDLILSESKTVPLPAQPVIQAVQVAVVKQSWSQEFAVDIYHCCSAICFSGNDYGILTKPKFWMDNLNIHNYHPQMATSHKWKRILTSRLVSPYTLSLRWTRQNNLPQWHQITVV